MKTFLVISVLLVVTHGQLSASVSGGSGGKPGGIEANGTIGAKDDDQNAQNTSATPQQSSSTGGGISGQSPDFGGFLKGISDGIGQFIQGFAQPIKTFGNTLCFAIQQGTNQALRLEDYIGQSFSISINGKPVYNGTITGGGGGSKRAQHGNKRVAKERHGAKHAN